MVISKFCHTFALENNKQLKIMNDNTKYIVKFDDDSMIVFDNVYEYNFFTGLRSKNTSFDLVIFALKLGVVIFIVLLLIGYIASIIV